MQNSVLLVLNLVVHRNIMTKIKVGSEMDGTRLDSIHVAGTAGR